MDADDNGDISYKEFCELCEEKRREIDPYNGKHVPRTKNSSPSKYSSSVVDNTSHMEDEDLSQKVADFKRKKYLANLLPSDMNQTYSYGIKSPECDNIDSIINNAYLHK